MRKMLYIDIESASVPKTGEVLIDKYWCVHPDKGIAFYERSKVGGFTLDRLSPQCNSDKKVSDMIVQGMKDHVVQKIPAIYRSNLNEKTLTQIKGTNHEETNYCMH